MDWVDSVLIFGAAFMILLGLDFSSAVVVGLSLSCIIRGW
jgi:hypothetical protein